MSATPSWLYHECCAGGGGGTAYAWKTDNFEQSAAWAAGGLTLNLSFVPADPDAVEVNFSNGNLFKGIDYSISGATITVLYAYDPADVGVDAVLFQVKYPYIP